MWPVHLQSLKLSEWVHASNNLGDAFTGKNIIWPLILTLKMFSSTLFIIWPKYVQRLKLLQPTVWEEMLLQKNTLFDI